MSDPWAVSVVIPTYNRRGRIGRSIESVSGQTKAPQAILVVDDGSTDGTADWVRKSYPGVTVIEQEHTGVSAARNRGIESAATDWIAFLDSDDCWMPDKLEKQMRALALNPGYRICHTEERWIYRGRERPVAVPYRKKGGWIFRNCLAVCAISPSTVVVHRKVFEEVGYFDESLPACEDYDLWLRITSRMPVLLVDELLIEKHGGHRDQLSAAWGLDRYRIRALRKILKDGGLDAHQRLMTEEKLKEKCLVFAKGLEKHGRIEEARYFRSLPRRGHS